MIMSAFYRSLMVYFMVPLHAAGIVTVKELNLMEANIQRKNFGLKGA
jgi:hypothetical protein